MNGQNCLIIIMVDLDIGEAITFYQQVIFI